MIRIKIGIMPSLLRSIMRSALESQEDFVIVEASASETDEAFDTVDVVILSGHHQKLGHLPIAALVRKDSPRVVTISADGHSASALRITAENSRIDATSDLTNVVRRAALERRKAIR